MRARETLILVGGSLLAVGAVSGATYALWGPTEALLVFSLGAVFAIIGNPVMWAAFFRSKERESIHSNTNTLPNVQEHIDPGTK